VTNFDGNANGHLGPAGSANIFQDGLGVLEAELQFNNYGLGNDVLTGGSGVGDVNYLGKGVNTSGNAGDNFFPEGGNDIVNLVANHSKAADTIWVASYDVSSTINSTGVTPHYIYGQAVTDIVGGNEVYVDNYGPGVSATTSASGVGNTVAIGSQGVTGSATSSLTVNNFVEGSASQHGDTLVFNPLDWAASFIPLNNGTFDIGLVNAHTGVGIGGVAGVALLAQETYIGSTAGAGGVITASTTVVEDGIAGYSNAAQLAKALATYSQGAIGGIDIAAHTTEHILVAYNNNVTGGVTIDDVTLVNTTNSHMYNTAGGTNINGTGFGAGLTVIAVDMVNIVGTTANPVSVGNLDPHNIQFFHM
jgi:hypothetical protein